MQTVRTEWRHKESGRSLVFIVGGYETDTLADAMKIKRVVGLPGDPDRPLTEMYEDLGPRVVREYHDRQIHRGSHQGKRTRGGTSRTVVSLDEKINQLFQKGQGA